jgi:hypothetical protein
MLTKEEIIKESQKIAIEKGQSGWKRGDVFEGARDGATWANDQNTARIAELEAMLSKSAFNLDGHIILLQAANQQIEKERQRISELEEQKAELIDGLFFALNAIVAWELKGGPKKQIIERIEKIIEKHSTKFPF